MIYFVIFLMVINTSYTGIFGNPIDKHHIVTSLNLLATKCESPFIIKQIKENNCSLQNPSSNREFYECLMFYDINLQLCSAKPSVNESDFNTFMQTPLDVEKLCESAKNWTPRLQEDSTYQHFIETVFKVDGKCSVMCAVDVFSNDTKFICKYYAWGSSLLKSKSILEVTVEASKPVTGTSVQDNDINTMISVPKMTAEAISDDIVKPKDEIKEISQKANLTSPFSEPNTELAVPLTVITKIEPPLTQQALVPSQSIPSVINYEKNNINTPEITKVSGEANLNVNQEGVSLVKTDMKDKDVFGQDKTQVKTEDNFNTLNKPDMKDNKAKQQIFGEGDEYQDSDEAKEGLGDTQGGDDGDDPMVGIGDLDPKPELDKPVDTVKRIESPIYNGDVSQREVYPNTMSEGFVENNDHFFPLFLTAVVMAVLLYMLYHNKNKVTKVFLGLIVEGRQPGRRRNSRGHLYRRLDTLEHAMSAAAPAAPASKIIY